MEFKELFLALKGFSYFIGETKVSSEDYSRAQVNQVLLFGSATTSVTLDKENGVCFTLLDSLGEKEDVEEEQS